jgi:hypothetical protein
MITCLILLIVISRDLASSSNSQRTSTPPPLLSSASPSTMSPKTRTRQVDDFKEAQVQQAIEGWLAGRFKSKRAAVRAHNVRFFYSLITNFYVSFRCRSKRFAIV